MEKNNANSSKKCFVLSIGSFFLAIFAQPDVSILASVACAIFGYALFWLGSLEISSTWKRFWLAFAWFALVQAWHLNWFFSDRYVGPVIFLVVAILSLILGLIFALFSLLVKPNLRFSQIVALSALWTIGEWARLFFLTGYSWNPAGLPLSATLYGMQIATIGGAFGLSFWVIFTNLLILKWLTKNKHRSFWIALSVASFPYFFGIAHVWYHTHAQKKSSDFISALLVQTNMEPEQKCPLPGLSGEVFTPLEQWKTILKHLDTHRGKKIDLIVLSEAVVPYGTDQPLFTFHDLHHAFQEVLRVDLPYDKTLQASNASWAHLIADHFDADVVAGFEDGFYNAAFFFQPQLRHRDRYEKRVLVPMGEYIPFRWCKKILKRWGIQDSFVPGKGAKVFVGQKNAVGVSICYEETFGNLMRENRLQGAQLLANLTNDVWYPGSRLPLVHYYHGRLRAVELGVPVVRACNTGLTCALDSLGRTVASLPCEKAGALHAELSSYTYKTPYTVYGDRGVIVFCAVSLLACLKKKRKLDFLHE